VYVDDPEYLPSDFALEFVNFIKLVNGEDGEENITPVLHYKMLDQVGSKIKNIANMVFRGAAKTSLFGEYLFLYLGTYGRLPGFGDIRLALYVSDSIENGVKNMRKNLEFRWENSEFLQTYIPEVRFTDIRWEFRNADGNVFIVKGYGAQTGVRGSKEMGKRPMLAVLDDLLSDTDAKSPTVIARIEDTVYKAIDYALHPKRAKIIWSGTPFNAKDPLYKAVESGAWAVNVYPICEEFPCSKENFRGAWEDRFPYEYVKAQYDKALKLGKIDTFNQELMLQIMSEEDRLILDSEICWYSRDTLLLNKPALNYYITTDFATSDKQAADFSVISVWGLNSKGYWFWVDGVCERQTMDRNIFDLFRLAQKWDPQQVGIEVSGQQGGFIPWIQQLMIEKNCFFNLASDFNQNRPGIRPNTNKMVRFNLVVPWFKAHQIFFPKELREAPIMVEAVTELSLVSPAGMKSKHDDFIDTISMLANLKTWRPSVETPMVQDQFDIWEMEDNKQQSRAASYIV
jgi:predicted phage terminase large subunit-like protein